MNKFKTPGERKVWLEFINIAPTDLLNLEKLTDDEKLIAIASYEVKYADIMIKKYRERDNDFS